MNYKPYLQFHNIFTLFITKTLLYYMRGINMEKNELMLKLTELKNKVAELARYL